MAQDVGLVIDGLDNTPGLKDVRLDGKPLDENIIKKLLPVERRYGSVADHGDRVHV